MQTVFAKQLRRVLTSHFIGHKVTLSRIEWTVVA